MSNCFQITLQNIHSLNKNFDDLQVFLESLSEKSSAICLTETWLKKFHHKKSMFLEGYRPLVNIKRKKEEMVSLFFYKKLYKQKLLTRVI